MIKNRFDRNDDIVLISHPEWGFVASASIRDDYAEELQSVSWSQKGNYLYSSKLGMYLHIYIARKWYGDDVYEKMKVDGYVVDHMDNDGYNCCINNLCFLMNNENKATGLTVDQYSKKKTHIALSLYRDFTTTLIQIAIAFNYPAIAKIKALDKPAVIEIAYLLYDKEYEVAINDARGILYDYYHYNIFEPEKLHDIDFHIEGRYGEPCPKEVYDEYIRGGHGHAVFYIHKKAQILGWTKEQPRRIFYLRGYKNG